MIVAQPSVEECDFESSQSHVGNYAVEQADYRLHFLPAIALVIKGGVWLAVAAEGVLISENSLLP
ncbi:hypothetical protein [Guyparkeria sp.]|uniref:hypothetical protein n=1 Tax=Guyparkeria sp. TaxID=2035736 RepID=UPI003970B48C